MTGPWVGELHRACERALGKDRTLRLDLGDVEYLDANGVMLLLSLRSRGVMLLHGSPFITEQLKETRRG